MTPKGVILSSVRRAAQTVLPPRALVATVAWSKFYLGEKEMRLLPWVCNRDRVGVDIGANLGVYTWHLRRLCSVVHAYEPIPELAQLLRDSLPGSVIHECALSERQGTRTLTVPVFNSRAFPALATLSHGFPDADRTETIDVQVSRLDDEAINGIGFIKIDVEGHERQVIEGASRVLEEQRPTLQIEIEDWSAQGGIAATVQILEQHDYDAWYFHDGRLHPVSTFDVATLQNRAMMTRDGWARGPYVNNFLFFPKVVAWQSQRRAIEKFAG